MNNYIDQIMSTNSPNHLLSIFSTVVGMKAKNVLELGVRDGETTLPLLYGTSLFGGHLTSVDINNTIWKCPEDLNANWTFIKSDAIEFLESQQNIKYDIIYVDDWHSYEHVKRELELLESMVDTNTIIMMHDLTAMSKPNYWEATNTSGEWANGGPHKAVNELDRDKWEWMTLPMDHGLTILRKRGEIIKAPEHERRLVYHKELGIIK